MTKSATDTLHHAVEYLASRCDGATKHDQVGFSAFDADFGHSLASQERWSEKQTAAAMKLLKRYRKQLKAAGIDIENLPEIPPAEPKPTSPKPAGAKPQRTATKKDDLIIINFAYNAKLVEIIKTIPGRRFNSNHPKHWTAPISAAALKTLAEHEFVLCEELAWRMAEMDKPAVETLAEIDVPSIKRELFPFQKIGVAFIESRDGKALIGDVMGLGKSIQAIAWTALHPTKRPVVIVCPSSLKFNWANEIHLSLDGQKVQILDGTRPHALFGDYIIINYDILPAWIEKLKGYRPQILIIDEAHFIKNNKAQRTQAVKTLAKNIPHVLALTGTPIINRPIEMFNAIQLVDKTILPSFWHFTQRYCDPKHNGFGWDFSGASNEQELHEILTNSIMLRRLKSEVLPDLPPKLHTYVPMDIDNRDEYTEAENDFISYLEASGKTVPKAAEHLVKIEELKQLTIAGKMRRCLVWIKDFLESTDEKLVLFAVHKKTIDILMDAFGTMAVKIDGSVSSTIRTGPSGEKTSDRDDAVKRFQNDPSIRLFIGNIKAAGTGLTLTKASNVAFLELPWTPGDLVQAEDRCHRIGQHDSVNIYYLLAKDTIEITIAGLIDSKTKTLDAVLDGKGVDETTPLITRLIRTYQRKGNHDGR